MKRTAGQDALDGDIRRNRRTPAHRHVVHRAGGSACLAHELGVARQPGERVLRRREWRSRIQPEDRIGIHAELGAHGCARYCSASSTEGKLRSTNVQPSSPLAPMMVGTRLNCPRRSRSRGWSGTSKPSTNGSQSTRPVLENLRLPMRQGAQARDRSRSRCAGTSPLAAGFVHPIAVASCVALVFTLSRGGRSPWSLIPL